jgi:hypothetical protein
MPNADNLGPRPQWDSEASRPKFSEGMDVFTIDSTTSDEVDAHLAHVLGRRGPLYDLSASALMLDYAPGFAKLHRRMADLLGRPDPVNILLLGTQNVASYMMLGWETGLVNQFISNRRNGLTHEQNMELVMFTQLYAGMRGLGHVYRAVGGFLPSLAAPTTSPTFAPGWTPDPEAFRSGLDLSTREMTAADRKNLERWYEKNIGYLPESICFGLKYHPEFVKVNRAKWEVAIRTLPKQFAPHLMIRLNMMSGNVDGVKEAVLLGRSWGITREYLVKGIVASVGYCTGPEGLYAPAAAVEDILDEME